VAAAPAPARLLVSVTEVRSTAAILWLRAARAGEVRVEVTVGDGAPVRRTTATAALDDDLLVRVPLDGLMAGTRHHYHVRQDGVRVEGSFTTAPAPDAVARVTFVWGGDLGGGGHCRLRDGGYRIFRTMAGRPADFFLFVGDTVYADSPCRRPDTVPGARSRATTLAEYRARHRYNREDDAVQSFLRRTPVFAIWDDHDVRNNFAGPSEPRMAAGRQAFVDYWPVAAGDDPHRLYRAARWGRLLELFILDTRQYRSDNAQPDGPDKTMLGEAQRAWLLDAVPASAATWKVIVSSVPLAIPTGRPEARDGWSNANVFGFAPEQGTGFSHERDAILRHFHARGVKNLVFVAADVHHAEVIEHQPVRDWIVHELIAGPLSAAPGRPRPLDVRLRPRSLFAQGGRFTFGEVTIEPGRLTVQLLDEQGVVLFTHGVTPE
jgi:alkaline phosphatase D